MHPSLRTSFAAAVALIVGCTTQTDAVHAPNFDFAGVDAPSAGEGPFDLAATSTMVPGATVIPPSPQRTGDAARGYGHLVNDTYIGLGIPWSGFSFAMSALNDEDKIPGRTGKNALVGYSFNVGTNRDGMEIASPSCLSCHASRINGQLVVGLGSPFHIPKVPSGTAIVPATITLGLTSVSELVEFQTFGAHLLASQEAGMLMVFGALASHRDPVTLAWSSFAQFDANSGFAGWVDTPPWWRTKKKHGLYANGMGRGDQVHHMMNMAVFSVEDVVEAAELDAMFVDIATYLRSIAPPVYPYPIDATLAGKGQTVFENTCSSCHGTYGANESYPNLLIAASVVGTDPLLATHPWANPNAVAWFSASYFGQGAELDPQPGYVAPPLDGIWATAPFFHNGSVPTLNAVIDSSLRPDTWPMSFSKYDPLTVGWDTSIAGPLYDTGELGYSNDGHTYGDALSSTDRAALLEYLKTL